jgi:hypothetical protein
MLSCWENSLWSSSSNVGFFFFFKFPKNLSVTYDFFLQPCKISMPNTLDFGLRRNDQTKFERFRKYVLFTIPKSAILSSMCSPKYKVLCNEILHICRIHLWLHPYFLDFLRHSFLIFFFKELYGPLRLGRTWMTETLG